MIPKKITEEFIHQRIQEIHYSNDAENKCTSCMLEVENGFKVLGTSYRQFSVKHDEEAARNSAFDKAIDKLWEYYTFLSHTFWRGNSFNTSKPKDYCVGDIFTHRATNSKYMILGGFHHAALIELKTGRLLNGIISVGDPNNITNSEWTDLAKANKDYLEKI